MQLKRRSRSGAVRYALGLLTANLFAAVAHAQGAPGAPAPTSSFDPGPDLGSGRTRVDSAVLIYQEDGGRVKATEPVVNATLNGRDGETLNIKLTSDTLSGATPNGATPWRSTQTFITPAQAAGTTSTVTSASGNSKIVTIPGTGTVARQYTTPANTLPVDAGFRDQRYAVDVGYSTPWGSNTRFSLGGAFSNERDYRSYSVNTGLTRDFFQHNTTLSASLNYEFDQSFPAFGTPTPFTAMSADQKGPDKTKNVVDFVAGVTQVMNRYWLTQLNYSVGDTSGYQIDPYRIISVVNPSSGAPFEYLYEDRPTNRLRQSIYFGNKIAVGPTFADLSARAYHDSWGITSYTVEASDRIPLGERFYVQPGGRYYSQGAADFFHNYLLNGQPLPSYASSDSRLSKFSAVTGSLTFGFKLTPLAEVYLKFDDYQQTGQSHPSGVLPGLANQDLFGGTNARSAIIGFSFAFY